MTHKSTEGIGIEDVRSISKPVEEHDDAEPRVTIPEKHPVMAATALGLLAMGMAAGAVAASRHIKNQRKTKE